MAKGRTVIAAEAAIQEARGYFVVPAKAGTCHGPISAVRSPSISLRANGRPEGVDSRFREGDGDGATRVKTMGLRGLRYGIGWLA